MTRPDNRLALMGAPGSPYTRKMLAVLRYRRIPYVFHLGSHRDPPPGMPEPKVKLLPTFYFPKPDGGVEAVVDSTPIIRRLEREHAGRSVLPPDPAVAFINDLIEDYADEWLTKPMFHYRWSHADDIEHAGEMLVYWQDPSLPDAEAAPAIAAISRRQIDRIYVVGSNPGTASTIEQSYIRLVGVLNALLQETPYLFGRRPSSADFALYGQLTQLAAVDPTPVRETLSRSRRIRAWVDRVEDLSGLEATEDGWDGPDEALARLKPLLTEIGRVYAPFLIANARAVMSGADTVETEIDGQRWTQPAFPYQAKCLGWLREGYFALPATNRGRVNAALAGTGCEALFA